MTAKSDKAIEAKDLAQVTAQLGDVVANAADAELAEVRQVLADLRRSEVELFRQGLRGDGLDPAGGKLVETPEIDREPVCCQLRNLVRRLPSLVRLIHKVQCYHHAPWRNFCRIRPINR